jgi:hypothetical protein
MCSSSATIRLSSCSLSSASACAVDSGLAGCLEPIPDPRRSLPRSSDSARVREFRPDTETERNFEGDGVEEVRWVTPCCGLYDIDVCGVGDGEAPLPDTEGDGDTLVFILPVTVPIEDERLVMTGFFSLVVKRTSCPAKRPTTPSQYP